MPVHADLLWWKVRSTWRGLLARLLQTMPGDGRRGRGQAPLRRHSGCTAADGRPGAWTTTSESHERRCMPADGRRKPTRSTGMGSQSSRPTFTRGGGRHRATCEATSGKRVRTRHLCVLWSSCRRRRNSPSGRQPPSGNGTTVVEARRLQLTKSSAPLTSTGGASPHYLQQQLAFRALAEGFCS
jgi:hypothetical protein